MLKYIIYIIIAGSLFSHYVKKHSLKKYYPYPWISIIISILIITFCSSIYNTLQFEIYSSMYNTWLIYLLISLSSFIICLLSYFDKDPKKITLVDTFNVTVIASGLLYYMVLIILSRPWIFNENYKAFYIINYIAKGGNVSCMLISFSLYLIVMLIIIYCRKHCNIKVFRKYKQKLHLYKIKGHNIMKNIINMLLLVAQVFILSALSTFIGVILEYILCNDGIDIINGIIEYITMFGISASCTYYDMRKMLKKYPSKDYDTIIYYFNILKSMYTAIMFLLSIEGIFKYISSSISIKSIIVMFILCFEITVLIIPIQYKRLKPKIHKNL